ncbi:hypothetical protein RUM44_010142 [Polyplax serrata]|uniref:Discoidin domain-containing protein n=1 Tax=Polyplax serrata TaxID=468196 RepID=A0ABR1AUZ1_POLSC
MRGFEKGNIGKPFPEKVTGRASREPAYNSRTTYHVIRYEAPASVGEKKLEDLSYDGTISNGQMKGGLGQLVDGLYGEDVFDPRDPSDAGSRWIGWLNESLPGQQLDITFEFDSPREFSFAHVYVNNMFTRSVQVFSSAMVFFSLDGVRYQPTPVRMTMEPDLSRESARNVSIPLENRVGKFVKIQFGFLAHWILISEISFESGEFQKKKFPYIPGSLGFDLRVWSRALEGGTKLLHEDL